MTIIFLQVSALVEEGLKYWFPLEENETQWYHSFIQKLKELAVRKELGIHTFDADGPIFDCTQLARITSIQEMQMPTAKQLQENLPVLAALVKGMVEQRDLAWKTALKKLLFDPEIEQLYDEVKKNPIKV